MGSAQVEDPLGSISQPAEELDLAVSGEVLPPSQIVPARGRSLRSIRDQDDGDGHALRTVETCILLGKLERANRMAQLLKLKEMMNQHEETERAGDAYHAAEKVCASAREGSRRHLVDKIV